MGYHQATASHAVVSVVYEGRTWNGIFTAASGEVALGSAYGSARAPVGEQEPGAVATDLLLTVVETWSRRQPAAA